MTRRPLLAASLVLLGATALACGAGDSVQKGITEMSSEKIAENVLEGATGGDLMAPPTAPVDLSDLPALLVPAGAVGKSRMNMTNEGGTGTLTILEAPGTVSDVVAWYKASLATWKFATELATGDGTMLLYNSPDDDHYAQITVAPAEGGKVSATVLYVAKFKRAPRP